MPLVHRTVTPRRLSSKKLQLSKTDSEFIAVNNGTLVNVLRQLASLVTQAGDIFLHITTITEEVGTRVRRVKLRLDELEVKAELFDPKLVPVPEGSLDDGPIAYQLRDVILDARFFRRRTRPNFLLKLYDAAGSHEPNIPPRSPVTTSKSRRHGLQRLSSHSVENSQRPASISALRDWKLDDYVDEKIATLDKKKGSTPEELNRALSKPFPSQVVSVDVTGRGFDRMKANRRSLIIHTKKIRTKKKRRNTICGSMPNKECGIQTSFSSVTSPSDTTHKKYGIDSGHWSSCTSEAQGVGAPSSSAPSPWDPNSLSTSSDFFFDDEDRSLTPQLENFTDGMVSDSDSVDTEGYFTSFRNECGFPKSKKLTKEGMEERSPNSTTENEYELFGKGSTSTTASSCGTVVLRNKPEPPVRTSSVEHLIDKKLQSEDSGWEERVKRKSLIERVPSLVVVTPSPSCSSASPPPLKDPELGCHESPQASPETGHLSPMRDSLNNDSESGTLSDTDSDKLSSEIPRASSSSTLSSCNSTQTLTNCSTNLPRPDVIPDVQVIRTMSVPKLDIGKQYFSLDTVSSNSVLLGSSEEEHHHDSSSGSESKMNLQAATSGKIRGARVVLDANGEIIFSSETLRRKRRHKVSFDPGHAVKPQGYDKESTYSRARDSIYDRIIRKDSGDSDKLYECIEEIRRHNLKESDAILEEKCSYDILIPPPRLSIESVDSISSSPRSLKSPQHAMVKVLLETDLDSAIPPVMPELKTLPKIKDRLKRNESYRIATDEVPPRAPPLSLSPLNLNNNNKRLSLNNMNKKRDIPEEDPAFIQQILNFSNSRNSPLRKSPDAFNRSITLSKLALSPDDRPSFLRRDSPPTMDDITKEIYRFRKKFNIQPNASSTKLCAPAPSLSVVAGNVPIVPRMLPAQRPLPPTPQRKPFSLGPPVSSSTPVKKCTIKPFESPNLYSQTPVASGSGPNVPKLPSLTTKILCALKPKTSTNRNPPKSVSFSIPQKTEMPLPVSNEPRSRTSLSDFKKLLLATKSSTKKGSISAVELLKPKLGLETTL